MPAPDAGESIASADLIRGLFDPCAYPHPVEGDITVVQTHISIVFLAGNRVYKVKKALDLGFLDYSTLEQRKHFCEEEVRLNRRLAPETYLGVARIVRSEDGTLQFVMLPDEGRETIDYAVVMKRLPAEGMLDARLDRGKVDVYLLDRLAKKLVAFHNACPTGDDVDRYATPEALRKQVDDNLRGLATFIGELDGRDDLTLTRAMHDRLRGTMNDDLARLEDPFRQRISAGRIREGHGDLHAGNICILDSGEIVIYDCIEFSAAFRCRDVASEVAFLAMELDRAGRNDLADAFIDSYAKHAGDSGLRELVPFYKRHFAIVKAKVESLKSREEEVDEADRAKSLAKARRYALLAVGSTLPPALIMTCGLPGTGKSTFARALAPFLRAEHLASDRIRKDLAGLEPTERGTSNDIYTDEFTRRTYGAMRDRARIALKEGRTVIADANFPARKLREPFIALGKELDVPVLIVHLTAAESTIRERMHARSADTDEVSDADWSVYEKAKSRFEPPVPTEGDLLILDSEDEPFDLNLLRVMDTLTRSHPPCSSE